LDSKPVDEFDQVVVSMAVMLSVPSSSADAACFLGVFGDSVSCNGRYFAQTGTLSPLTAVTHSRFNCAFTNITDLEEVATLPVQALFSVVCRSATLIILEWSTIG
jgi:hypothetical protein